MWWKVYNALLLFTSYYASKLTGRAWHKGLPISVAIEPTTACNLRCPQCPSGLRAFTRPTGFMDFTLFTKAVDELSRSALWLTLYFQGESYLHKQFFDMVKYATQKGMWVSTSTNAHYLSIENAEKTIKSGLKKMIISLDGATQATYETYRVGGHIDSVWDGLHNMQRAKKKFNSIFPQVVIQFIVFKHNEHEIPIIKKKAKDLGVKLVLKTAQIYDNETAEKWLPNQPRYARYYVDKNGVKHLKNAINNECWRMWHSTVITWDGQVVPCCFDKDAQHSMGSLQNHTFKQIWKNNVYQSFREGIFTNRQQFEICKNCTEGSPVFI